jgi:hypothetical protein
MATLKRKVATVELASGEVIEVRIIHPDVLRYQETAQKHGWPAVTVRDEVGTVPHLSYEDTFCAWAALRRTGQYSGKWETFKDTDCVQLDVEEEDVRPTEQSTDGATTGPVVGSVSSLPMQREESESTG